jgi:hypothetical protein
MLIDWEENLGSLPSSILFYGLKLETYVKRPAKRGRKIGIQFVRPRSY